MSRSDWDRLAAPFPAEAITWRVLEVAPDGRSARVRASLTATAIAARLDEVVGPDGWRFRFQELLEAVACELSIGNGVRSAVASRLPLEAPEDTAQASLALAAEFFGMRPPFDTSLPYWVDYDPDEGISPMAEAAYSPAVGERSRGDTAGVAPIEGKPQGQQVIDRLVERLKDEGLGLEAARLLVEYGGYGSDPQTARELYGRLRELLTGRAQRTA